MHFVNRTSNIMSPGCVLKNIFCNEDRPSFDTSLLILPFLHAFLTNSDFVHQEGVGVGKIGAKLLVSSSMRFQGRTLPQALHHMSPSSRSTASCCESSQAA